MMADIGLIARGLLRELRTDAKGMASRLEYRARKALGGTSKSGGSIVSMVRGTTRYSSRMVNAQQVLEAFQTSPWFQAVITRVAFAAAVVPWRLYAVKSKPGSRDERDGRAYVKHSALQAGASLEIRDKIAKTLTNEGRLEEIEDHLIFDLLSNPNPILSGVDTRLVTFASLMVVGEIGWAIERAGPRGAPSGIWPVPTHWIMRRPSDGADGYEVRVGASTLKLGEDEFVMFRNPNIANPYGAGVGIGSALADELENDEYISKFQNTWFTSRGRPDLMVVAKPGPDGSLVDKDELQRAEENFQNLYSDVRKSGGAFFTRGDLSVHELSQKFVDLDLTEQRSWIKDLVRQVTGTPPEVMGDIQNSNRATIQEALAILAMLSTVPQCERMRAQLQMSFVPMFDERIALGYWSPVPEDQKFKLEAIKAAPWTVEVGEMRELQGLESRGDADRVHWVPMNLTPLPAPKAKKEAPPQRGKQLELVYSAPSTKELTDDVVAALQPKYFEQELTPELRETVETWGNRTLEELGLSPAFNMVNPLTDAYLATLTGKMVGINSTTETLIREQLRQGLAAGEGIPELSRRLTSTMEGMTTTRAPLIARTEVIGASNNGIYSAHVQSGIVDKRQWIATFDSATRDTHSQLQGMVVGINEPFVSSSGYEAMYPGSFGVAEEDCNCRCTTIAVIDGKSTTNLREVYRAFIDRTDEDEKRVKAAVIRAFEAQTRAMLEVLQEAAA